MDEFGITTEDIDAVKAKSKGINKSKGISGPKEKIIKYNMGDNTWSGSKGPKPKWVKELLDQCNKLEDYLVDKIKHKNPKNKITDNSSELLF